MKPTTPERLYSITSKPPGLSPGNFYISLPLSLARARSVEGKAADLTYCSWKLAIIGLWSDGRTPLSSNVPSVTTTFV